MIARLVHASRALTAVAHRDDLGTSCVNAGFQPSSRRSCTLETHSTDPPGSLNDAALTY
jgi:hypothetical protein